MDIKYEFEIQIDQTQIYVFEAEQKEYYADIVTLCAKDYDIPYIKAKQLIEDFDLYDAMEDKYKDELIDILRPRYETEAAAEFIQQREYNNNPEKVLGVSRRGD